MIQYAYFWLLILGLLAGLGTGLGNLVMMFSRQNISSVGFFRRGDGIYYPG